MGRVVKIATEKKLRRIRPGEIVIGTVMELDPAGTPLVDYPGNPERQPVPAQATLPLSHKALHRRAALLFAEGDLGQPIIVGLLHDPQATNTEHQAQSAPAETASVYVQLDGQRIVLSAQQEIVLHCGKASITLTQAGKIIVRGAYVSSYSSGVNRIKGGAVEIN